MSLLRMGRAPGHDWSTYSSPEIWIIVSPSLQHRGRRRWPMIALGSMTENWSLGTGYNSTAMPSICIPSSNSSWNMASIDGFQKSAQRFHGFNLEISDFQIFQLVKKTTRFKCRSHVVVAFPWRFRNLRKLVCWLTSFLNNNSLIEVGGINWLICSIQKCAIPSRNQLVSHSIGVFWLLQMV